MVKAFRKKESLIYTMESKKQKQLPPSILGLTGTLINRSVFFSANASPCLHDYDMNDM